MKADVIVKAASVIANAAGKVADIAAKENLEHKKVIFDTTSKIIDASSMVTKSVMDASLTTHADVELTKEYKTSSCLDKILDAQIKLITEDKMTSEIEKRLNDLKKEEVSRKESDENRASNKHRNNLIYAFVGCYIMVAIIGGTMFVLKNIPSHGAL